LHKVEKKLQQRLHYAVEEDRKASQNASKDLSRRHHGKADSTHISNNDGECELDG